MSLDPYLPAVDGLFLHFDSDVPNMAPYSSLNQFFFAGVWCSLSTYGRKPESRFEGDLSG
ncbi:hypothetical protein HSR122_1518 [Halapricum desulfuricans]|uniref:Uncharacterized protein n=1 Tax=Halapricum desulfuricans TaxID=2841257 RepID=A0A897N3E4_9EURY|nr:hypothetical protein HSR122_1518 [Halapricum desulfuricans]